MVVCGGGLFLWWSVVVLSVMGVVLRAVVVLSIIGVALISVVVW